MKYSIYLLFLIGFMSFVNLISCSAMTQSEYHFSDSKDSINVVKSIKGFLKWYKNHYKRSSGYVFVQTDKKGNYFVDQKVCEKYLKLLKSSGYISDACVKKWRNYFSEMGKNFINNPQNEGPPEGFDYDLISGTQEPYLFYNPSEKLIYNIVKWEKTKVIIKSRDMWEHQFTLSKSDGNWKIDDIEILGYPVD